MSAFLQRFPSMHASRPCAESRLRTRRSFRRAALRLGFALVIGCAMSAGAQDSTVRRDSATLRRDRWIVGPSIGMPTVGGDVSPEMLTIGLQFTRVDPGHLGADMAVGTLPRALAEGVAAFGFRADAAYTVSLSPKLLVLPAAGLSVIAAMGPGGGGGTMGINAGLAAVFHSESQTGLRVGVTAHQFTMAEVPIFLIEVGVVRMPGLEP